MLDVLNYVGVVVIIWEELGEFSLWLLSKTGAVIFRVIVKVLKTSFDVGHDVQSGFGGEYWFRLHWFSPFSDINVDLGRGCGH